MIKINLPAIFITISMLTCMLSHLNAQEGIIIILNGPSSVGKSSIQKALQKQSKEPFIRIGIDTFFDALIEEPDLSNFEKEKKFDQYAPNGDYIRGIELTKDENDHSVVTLKIGPAGDRIMFGMHRAIAAYAKAQNNVIVDYILYKPSWLDDLTSTLKGSRVYYVGVNAPLEVIEAREKARNTSPCGHARSHYDIVHKGFSYDLEIDSSLTNPEASAEKILNYIQSASK